MTEPKLCLHCKFRVDLPPPAEMRRVDYTLHMCVEAAKHVPCYESRNDGPCGPDGKLWKAK